jgi:hypothetical protein
MISRTVHNSIAIVLSLGVAWHSIVGCCAHHAHSQAACGDSACCDSNTDSDSDCLCGHRCEHQQGPADLSESPAGFIATWTNGNFTPGQCLGGKCAFVTGGKSPVVPPADGVSLDLLWNVADVFAAASSKSIRRLDEFRPPTLIGASSARPQQLLCVWLI